VHLPRLDVFITNESMMIFGLGAASFVIATFSGVLFAKVMNVFSSEGNKVNPLIGNAGVSAVPDSARVSQHVGLEYDKTNHLLMHAMAANVSGVIGRPVLCLAGRKKGAGQNIFRESLKP
jgi:carboxybiotin decarboxylase